MQDMLIDSHSHLNFAAFKGDFKEVIKRSLDNNVQMVNVGTKYETSRRAVEIAKSYNKGVLASVGLHPIYAAADLVKVKTDPKEGSFRVKKEDFKKEDFLQLAKSEKVVAIGEVGLDYYYRPKSKRKKALFKEKQKEVLIKQIDLAQELNLPLIFHCRMAHTDLLEILRGRRGFSGVIHCFTGSWEQAEEYLKMGFYLGINGIIFKLDLEEVVKKAPLEKILIETDCPYLTPPRAEKERNEPLFVKYVAEKVAGIKDISFEKVAGATSKNAKDLFGI